jgi:sulfatase modifying factor 1
MSHHTRFLVGLVVLAFVGSVQADIVMETAPVGNLDNTGEWSGESYGGLGHDAFVGGVDYAYNIGKYEVTAGQYRDFLNAVDPAGSNPYLLYNSDMDGYSNGCQITWNAGSSTYDFSGAPSGTEADWADRPVNFVSWYDTLRFANWMHNGQGSGDTENGAYNMSLGLSVVRNPGATWFLPTEDEWYKSAYHKNDGATGNYFDYPTSSDSVPSNDLDGSGNNATFYISYGDYTIGGPYLRTEVGAHVNSESPYGTFDQGGNVWEWNEAIVYSSRRGLRGGSWGSAFGVGALHAALRYDTIPTYEAADIGFRVAQVPEPATLSLLALGGIVALRRRR